MINKTKIVFASGNAGKIREMTDLINKHLVGRDDLGAPQREIELLGLKDIGFTDEIIEDGGTFEANAELKARAVFEKTGMICFADDSGLCVDYLNGDPGVDTALYGGTNGKKPHIDISINKLLQELSGVPDDKRAAHFICVICCIVSPAEKFFVSGRCDGFITREKIGEFGFGYDPVFYYPPKNRTFAEISDEEKNKISHRAKAAEQFAEKIVKYII